MKVHELCLGPGWGEFINGSYAIELRCYQVPMDRELVATLSLALKNELLVLDDGIVTFQETSHKRYESLTRLQQLTWQPISYFDELKMAASL